MNSHNRRSWVRRNRFILVPVVVCVAFLGQRVYSRAHFAPPADPVPLICDPAPIHKEEVLPVTHYLFSERYGWFDQAHFNTGHPQQLLADVQAAVERGGGSVMLSQGVRDDLTGYTAVYTIAENLAKTDVVPVALGIYMDWSVRFEAWQGQPPHGLFGPLTPFAVEDLPSQYLGFYAAAHNLPVASLFACYLGPIVAVEEGPPDFVSADNAADGEGVAGIARLQNHSFTPLVETETGWQPLPWPEPLQMEPAASSPETWQFVMETTWYGHPDDGSTSKKIK